MTDEEGPGGVVTAEVRARRNTRGSPSWLTTIEDRLSAATVTGGLWHAGAVAREAERGSDDLGGAISIAAGRGRGRRRTRQRGGERSGWVVLMWVVEKSRIMLWEPIRSIV